MSNSVYSICFSYSLKEWIYFFIFYDAVEAIHIYILLVFLKLGTNYHLKSSSNFIVGNECKQNNNWMVPILLEDDPRQHAWNWTCSLTKRTTCSHGPWSHGEIHKDVCDPEQHCQHSREVYSCRSIQVSGCEITSWHERRWWAVEAEEQQAKRHNISELACFNLISAAFSEFLWKLFRWDF